MEDIKSLKERVTYCQIAFAIADQRYKEAKVILDHIDTVRDHYIREIKTLDTMIMAAEAKEP